MKSPYKVYWDKRAGWCFSANVPKKCAFSGFITEIQAAEAKKMVILAYRGGRGVPSVAQLKREVPATPGEDRRVRVSAREALLPVHTLAVVDSGESELRKYLLSQ